MPTLRVGLTGGIGCGKSTVAECFRRRGIPVIDTDAISRALTAAGGRAIPEVQAHFGAHFIDPRGAMDRSRMRELVFHDPSAKQALENLLHPMITEEAQTQALTCIAPLQIFDVPLLIETGRWRHHLHRIIVVDCDEGTQIQRVAQRPGWNADLAAQVLRQQSSRNLRQACADILIANQHINLQGLDDWVSVAIEQLQRWACETMAQTSA